MITKWKHDRDASQMPLSGFERIQLKRLCEIAKRLDMRLAIPASSSNFSMRSGSEEVLITRSGLHKRLITPSSFLRVRLTGQAVNLQCPKPSDETLLHCALYKMFSEAQFVVHCHPIEIEQMNSPKHCIEGHELLKALGLKDHNTSLNLPVFANSQNMSELALNLPKSKKEIFLAKGFVLQQHGIYVWGNTLEGALWHLEAILHLSKLAAS
jgi:methylthioribulose-1-phosphate dehydratase